MPCASVVGLLCHEEQPPQRRCVCEPQVRGEDREQCERTWQPVPRAVPHG